MPTSYFTSDWLAYGSGANLRTVIAVDGVPTSIDTNTSQVNLTQRLHLESDKSLVDSSNFGYLRWEDGNGQSASGVAVSHGSSGGSTKFIERTRAIATSYDTAINVYVAGLVSGLEVVGTGTQVTVPEGYVTIPRRPYGTPGTPTGLTYSGLTPTGFTVAFNGPSSWGGSAERKYEVQRANDAAFTSGVVTTTLTATRTLAVTGLANNTPYYVRVRARNDDLGNGGGVSAWTATMTVTTAVAVPGTPGTPSFSAVTTSGFTVAYTDPATWGGNDTSAFDVQYATNSGFTSGVVTVEVAGNSVALSGLSPNVTYYVRVRARNSAGPGAWSTVNYQLTLTAVPGTPGTPSVSALTNTGCTLAWAAPTSWGGDDDGDYDVQRATNSGFTSGVVTTAVNDARTLAVSGLMGNTSYWERVRAKNSAGTGSFSGSISFLTAPSKVTASGVSGLSPTGATLTATAPAGGAASYRLQVATDAGFANVVHDSTDTSLARTLTGLTPDTTYYLRWLTTNATGNVGWSSTFTFDTEPGAYVWNGSAWAVVQSAHVWNGSAWVQVQEFRVWSGGVWQG